MKTGKQATHTPGPWVAVREDEYRSTIEAEGGERVIGSAFGQWDDTTEKHAEIEPNAKLIAAAPDLLSTLQKVRAAILDRADVIDGSEGPRPNLAMDIQSEVFDLIDSAILKAGGSNG